MSSINLDPVIQAAAPYIVAALATVVGAAVTTLATFTVMLINAVRKKFHLQAVAVAIANYTDGIQKSAAFGVSQVVDDIERKGWTHIDVKNAAVAAAVNQAITAFPGAIAAVGLDPTVPADKVQVSKAIEAAMPAAMTAAAASPITPPAPPTILPQTTVTEVTSTDSRGAPVKTVTTTTPVPPSIATAT